MVGYEGGKYAEGAKRAKAKLLGTYQKALSLYSDGISKDQPACHGPAEAACAEPDKRGP